MSHRLYIITGKGGVGKTSLSLSLAKKLAESGSKVLYNSFDQEDQTELCEELNIPSLHLELEKSAEIYMGKKLGSEMVASWIMKTPFFKSLFNMIPGLGHMILLGHVIDLLEDDPTLTIILDSPSSGHAMTMFESSHNFKEIFGSGLLVEDINRMHRFIYAENSLKNYIVSLPTKMALNESKEVKEHLQDLNFRNTEVIINDCLSPLLSSKEELPDFLKIKNQLETAVIEEYKEVATKKVPHSLGEDFQSVILDLSKKDIGELL
ncbi:ArsA-related P-loop ATPase [Halobacteriovorax sp. JY17]|uniref:ArsA-related P-loop ATPase n=1 Tax=Halobacteriovorax sp. JY17 TaxID=2014617 RepID=UPI000C3558B1|nr:ArsA-related P-loop ATPase [Halobacteriovorax sp. JY17]PIK13915.1 MAG: hypothetical protein CES88_13095 [Halobacteriovorax sp. JY17]